MMMLFNGNLDEWRNISGIYELAGDMENIWNNHGNFKEVLQRLMKYTSKVEIYKCDGKTNTQLDYH